MATKETEWAFEGKEGHEPANKLGLQFGLIHFWLIWTP